MTPLHPVWYVYLAKILLTIVNYIYLFQSSGDSKFLQMTKDFGFEIFLKSLLEADGYGVVRYVEMHHRNMAIGVKVHENVVGLVGDLLWNPCSTGAYRKEATYRPEQHLTHRRHGW